ncbi:phosphohydrolase [candidate division KSB3 bacterium]|uniref:Phosphohydrolase n=1 Tax=candidate division KSB3 bacterium TaxID=2044937 RepID=A0A2G6E4F2_9BACT|nr:MAG: phosphohydrolase [candidate division KSB3 bacterium]PIE29483.1 MAG: phosphohydrolase [candidate division KSB3 bacterium]
MKQSAVRIVQILREHGFTAFWAGGCVRDMLMHVQPEDYDIVTNADRGQVRNIFRRTIPVGEQFGICIVVFEGQQYEIAEFRHSPPDSALDEMIREDSLHRDFSINSMIYDPIEDRIYDYAGGRDDLRAGLIRGTENPRERFLEDRLRLARAVRFAASLNYTIEETTFSAMQDLAPDIVLVSAERIREELLKILLSPLPLYGIDLLDQSGLLRYILPEVFAMKGVQQDPEFHPEGDVFEHTRRMLQLMKNVSPELAMAVLLHDIGKAPTCTKTDRIRFHGHASRGAEIADELCLRLKFSTKSTERIVRLVREHQKFLDVMQMKTSSLKRFLRQEYFPELLELHRLDCLSSQRSLVHYHFCQNMLKDFQQEAIYPPRLLSGKDLLQLGFTPGPQFTLMLNAVEDAQLEGTVASKEDALELLKELEGTFSCP